MLGIENKASKDHDGHEEHHHVENELADAVLEREQEDTQTAVLGHERKDTQDAQNVEDLDVVVHFGAPRIFPLVLERLCGPEQGHDGQELEEIVGILEELELVGRGQEAQHVLDGEEDVARELDFGEDRMRRRVYVAFASRQRSIH